MEKVLAQLAQGNSNEHISVCPTISAAGALVPPLLVYKGSKVIGGLLSGEYGTVAAFIDTGYMPEDIFHMYIEHFARSIPPARPAMLMLDGHASHIDLVSITFCRDKTFFSTFCRPTPLTYFNHRKLKLEFDKASDRYRMDNRLKVVTKHSFAQVSAKRFARPTWRRR